MFWEACTSCHQPIITMPSAYYLTATENAAWAREVLEAFADNHAKIHVGFKEVFSWFEENKLFHPTRTPDPTVWCCGTSEVTGEVEGTEGFTGKVCRLKQNQRVRTC